MKKAFITRIINKADAGKDGNPSRHLLFDKIADFYCIFPFYPLK